MVVVMAAEAVAAAGTVAAAGAVAASLAAGQAAAAAEARRVLAAGQEALRPAREVELRVGVEWAQEVWEMEAVLTGVVCLEVEAGAEEAWVWVGLEAKLAAAEAQRACLQEP